MVLFPSLVSATDVSVWKGQYRTGTTFNAGTYDFNFTVYDSLTGGTACYSNTASLTTGNWGEWETEQSGVGASCNDVSKDYFLNVNIDGTDQIPRRRLLIWNFLRKDVDELTTGKLQTDSQIIAPIIQADTQIIAPIIQADTQIIAPVVNASQIMADNLTTDYVSARYFIGDGSLLTNLPAGEEADPVWTSEKANYYNKTESDAIYLQDYLETDPIFAANRSSIWDAINGRLAATDQRYNDTEAIALKLDAADQRYNESAEVATKLDITDQRYNDTEAIATKLDITDQRYNDTNWAHFAFYTKTESDMMYLQNYTETDPIWAANSSTVARTGNCPAGQVAQNTTTGGVQCITPGSGGLASAYLASNLTATNAGYTTIFTIALTPGKMNVVKAYLVQSSPTNGVAIRNRAIVSESGPIGNCNFVTQNGAAAEKIDNIAVSANSADTGSTSMSLDTNVPFINTVTCAVLADANQKNLIIQFDSETAATVTTYAGAYYTNAVN